MKIGFDGKRAVCNNTGLGNYSRLLVKVLSNHYPDLEYALYTPEKRDNPRLMPLLTRQGVSVATPDKPLWKAVPALWRVAAMARQMARDGVDIIHGLSGELPFDLAASRLPSVVTVHDLISAVARNATNLPTAKSTITNSARQPDRPHACLPSRNAPNAI